MVWFHGGGFSIGSGSWPVYNGAALARRGDVVVVTVNHRLGIYGYLHLGELAGPEYASSENAGMLDLVAALEWVRDNIAAFGGDPQNVMIFGESGGGAKVSTLLAMPAAAGLFHRAVVQSGPGLRVRKPVQATESAEQILMALGVDARDRTALAALTTGASHGGAEEARSHVVHGFQPGNGRHLCHEPPGRRDLRRQCARRLDDHRMQSRRGVPLPGDDLV
jgi:para-nitrobenzyl esterase